MAITNEFKTAVKENNTRMVRIMIKNSLVYDPTFKESSEMLSMAEPVLIDLYDEHNGEKLDFITSHWNKEYMDKQMVQIVFNFSKERLELLKKICGYLYSDRIDKINSEREKESKEKSITNRKLVGGGVVLAGAAATTVGLVIVEPVLISVGIATMVIGGMVIAID